MDLYIDQRRLQSEIETLAGYSSEAAPVVTRVVYSPADREARAYLKGLFLEAGLIPLVPGDNGMIRSGESFLFADGGHPLIHRLLVNRLQTI